MGIEKEDKEFNYSGLPNMREEFLTTSQFLLFGAIVGVVFMVYMLITQ
jgi:hypothetical protein